MSRKNSVVVSLVLIGVSLCLYAMPGEASRRSPAEAVPERALHGEAAIQRLKAEGSYTSLAAAMAAVHRESAEALATGQGKLRPQGDSEGALFGSSVALDGDTAVIGAPNDDAPASDQGSAYVFFRDQNGWSVQQKLVASDLFANDHFGAAVAIEGDTIAVGAPNAGLDRGAVYVYTRMDYKWIRQPKLVADDSDALDLFGCSVALKGSVLAVGAKGNTIGSNKQQGSVYIFAHRDEGWKQQQQLSADRGAAEDLFGASVAVWGETVLVGAPEVDIDGARNQGAAYVFTRSGTIWSQRQQLLAGDGAMADFFGCSVALNGDTAAVGAKMNDHGLTSLDEGSVYTFNRSGAEWLPQDQIWPADGEEFDQFGQSVALDGELLLVGAAENDLGANQEQGAAYLFVRKGSKWYQQRRLFAEDGSSGDRFGVSVALSGDAMLVGANQDSLKFKREGSAYVLTVRNTDHIPGPLLTANDGKEGDFFGQSVALSGDVLAVGASGYDGAAPYQGAVYIFTRSGDTWVPQQKLTPGGAAASERFGWSVALHGDTLVVGAFGYNQGRGGAYIFTRNGAVWSQDAILTDKEGLPGDVFGNSVAIHNGTVVVGAPLDAIGQNQQQGSASIFVRSGGGWQQLKKIIAADGVAGEAFGMSVAISGATLVVGAPRDYIGTNYNLGSAYVFTYGVPGWIQEKKLTASDGAIDDSFGYSVAVSGDNIAVGSKGAQVGKNHDQGAAYIFSRVGGLWMERQRLKASDGVDRSSFGSTLALNGDTLVVGAPDSGPNGDQRKAYIFTLRGAIWTEQQAVRLLDGSAEDALELPVAVSDDAVAVGAYYYDVDRNVDQGAALVFITPACRPATLDPIALPGGRVGSPYGEKLRFEGDNAPYQFSIAYDALPPGLTLNPAGAVLGTPTVPGEYRFTISALNLNTLCRGNFIYTLTVESPSNLGVATCVSAANFLGPVLASESIVAVFGKDFSDAIETAETQPLPTSLARTSVLVRDRDGVETLAQLFYVSPNQINLLLPPGMSAGSARVRVLHVNATVAEGVIRIEPVAPALFSADSSGQGLLVGVAVHVQTNGSVRYEPIVTIDPQSNRLIAAPIDLGSTSDRVYLTLFGTGLRSHSSLASVGLTIGGVEVGAQYAGPQGSFSGLDQVNVELPYRMAGRGEVDVTLTVDGKPTNTLKIAIK
jgi:uncharacterized protein (TIGR03437 family)